MPPHKKGSDLKEPLLSSTNITSDQPTQTAPSISTTLTISSLPQQQTNDSEQSRSDKKRKADGADDKDKKPEQSLEDILIEEQEKSTAFLIQREEKVRKLWWAMLLFHFVVFLSLVLSWALYYEPYINFFTKKGITDLIKNYDYKISLSDVMLAITLRTVLTFATLISTFSDEKRITILNSIAYWFTATVFILSLCKSMVISYHTGETTDTTHVLSSGQHFYRIIVSILSSLLSLLALLLHQWFNPLDLEVFQDDEIQQQEFLKRQKLHHQEIESLEYQATLLSDDELTTFLQQIDDIKKKYEAVEHQLKRARMAAKQLEDSASFSEFFWLLRPYFWPRGLLPKIIVFSTWVVLIGSKVCSIMAPIQIGHATDQLQKDGTVPWKYFLLFTSLTFGTNALKQLQSLIYLRVKQQAFVELSGGLMEHILSLSLSWHHTKTLGKTTRSVDRGLNAAENVVSYLFLMLLPSAFEALTIFILFFQKFKQPLISAIIFFHLSIYSIATVQLTILRKPMRQKARQHDNQFHSIITDALQNIEIVKLYNKEKYESDRYTQAISLYQASTITTQATLSLLNGLQTLIIQSCLCLCLFVVGWDIAHGYLTIGTLSSMIAFMANLFAPLSWLGSIYDVVIQAFIDASVVLEMQRLSPGVVEYNNAVKLQFDEKAPLIEFKDVTFYYDPAVKHGLTNFSLTINRGERLAIVGETGSGKSTFTKLLLRFYDPTSGAIHINGQDIKYATNASLKESLIMVPQDTTLFNDNILNNIIYSHPTATHDEIIKCCTLAGIIDFVSSLDLGFYTVVGERGLRLSGGQRQRLCIARSMLKRFRGALGSSTDVLGQTKQVEVINTNQNDPNTPLLTNANNNGGINSTQVDYTIDEDALSSTQSNLTEDQMKLNQSAKDYMKTEQYQKDSQIAKELWGIGRIIIADEPTSAVDVITERLINRNMCVLEEGATSITITHRLTNVTHFDRIVVMKDGRILEQGSHEELLNTNGTYALMYAQQFVKEKITDISPEELATTIEYVKQFTTNPIFSGTGGISAASLSDLKSGNLTPQLLDIPTSPPTPSNNASATNSDVSGTTTPTASSTLISSTQNSLLSDQLASAEAIELARNSLKMGHIYNKVLNNPANQRGRGRRG